MKKVIFSLIISGLSISGDCFAAQQSNTLNAKQSWMSNKLVEIKDLAANARVKAQDFAKKTGSNVKKALKRKDVQIALGAAAVIGFGIAVYYFIPGVSNSINSNSKTALDVVKNSEEAPYPSEASQDKWIISDRVLDKILNDKISDEEINWCAEADDEKDWYCW